MDLNHPMEPQPAATSLRLAEILAALSKALDLTEGQPPGHCVRCCYIGVRIGEEIGLDAQAMGDPVESVSGALWPKTLVLMKESLGLGVILRAL